MATDHPKPPSGQPWEGHYPVVGGKMVENFRRPPKALIEKFREIFVPDIVDAVGPLYCMDASIRPAYSGMPRLLGTAWTVKVPPGDNMMVQRSTHSAKPGDILVVDARGCIDWSLGGGGMVATARHRGILGMVLDGAFRDIDQVENLHFPMFLKGIKATSPTKRGPGEINVPVNCGGVIVHPGDIIVGDREGVVVISQQYAEQIYEAVKDKPFKSKEEDWDWSTIVSKYTPRDNYYIEVMKARGYEWIKEEEE